MKGRLLAIVVALVVPSCGDDSGVETTAACPPVDTTPAEFDAWTTADGCAVSPDRVQSHDGPEECGWELVDYLVFDGRAYHFDPVNFLSYVDGLPRNRTVRVADLGGEVADTGFRRGDEQLWSDAADPKYVYVVHGNQADRYLFDSEGAIVCQTAAHE